jgi:hypothetical protein
VRKAICPLTAGGGTLLIVGCGSGHSIAPVPQPKTASSATASLGSLVVHPQEAVLRLSRGSSTAGFQITAVPHDTWDVQIGAPASADFEVDALKSDGERLSLLETARGCTAFSGSPSGRIRRPAVGRSSPRNAPAPLQQLAFRSRSTVLDLNRRANSPVGTRLPETAQRAARTHRQPHRLPFTGQREHR